MVVGEFIQLWGEGWHWPKPWPGLLSILIYSEPFWEEEFYRIWARDLGEQVLAFSWLNYGMRRSPITRSLFLPNFNILEEIPEI